MKREITVCDICSKEHNNEYALRPPWITIQQNNVHGFQEEEKHFCSKECLIKWAQKDDRE